METKTYNAVGMKILLYLGLAGALLMAVSDINIGSFTRDLAEMGLTEIISIGGNLLYSIVMCIFLYCTMSKFEAEGIQSPAKGIFIAAIVLEIISAIILCLTDNFEDANQGTAVLGLITMLTLLVIIILLAIGFFKANHGTLSILLILAIVVPFICESLSSLGKDLQKWVLIAYAIFSAAPFGYFASMLSGQSDKEKEE